MKTTFLILALFLISFSLESSIPSEDLALEQSNEVIKWDILHYTENGEYIVLNLTQLAIIYGHMHHVDDIICIPPCRP